MQFSKRRVKRRSVDLNLTPMMDLFLNILIFFLVTTTFSKDTIFRVELPESSAKERVGKEERYSIAVNAEGEIALNNRTVNLEELEKELEKVPQDSRAEFPILLRADDGSRHGLVVSILDLARREGFQNLGIATKVKPGASP